MNSNALLISKEICSLELESIFISKNNLLLVESIFAANKSIQLTIASFRAKWDSKLKTKHETTL